MNRSPSLAALFMALLIPGFIAPAEAEEKKKPEPITIAYLYNGAPPLSYTENGEHTGILIDIVKEIGNRANLHFEMTMMMRDEIDQRLASKKIDGVVVGIYRNDTTKKRGFLYSAPFLDDLKIMEYKEQHYQNAPLFDNAENDNIVMQGVNGIYSFLSRTFNDNFNADCRKVERGEITFAGLDVEKNPPCDHHPESNYVGIQYFQQAYFFPLLIHNGIRDIDFSLELSPKLAPHLNAINNAIKTMKQDGTIDRIMQHYVVPKRSNKPKKRITKEHEQQSQLYALGAVGG